MPDSFTFETFQPLIGSSFVIAGSDDALELVEANALGSGPSGSRDPFSLLFLRRSNAVLLDDTYTLTHPALGSFEMFIVPVAQDAEGVRYEAIFN